MEKIERMADFFAARVDSYDEHMLYGVGGCLEGYSEMAKHIPEKVKTLLDLGCGTGLELDAIFKKLPDVSVTGIDITVEMLDRLREKYPDRSLDLICGDYFVLPFGENSFDCAVSFETLHHFSEKKKSQLYKKLFSALKKDGIYIECDYMVDTQQEQDLWFGEYDRIKTQQGIKDEGYYHYDTPCTVENQIKMLKSSGFTAVTQVFRYENTVMLIARK